jgi:hypothetical protein
MRAAFFTVGAICGASTYGFLRSPAYVGAAALSVGVLWALFFAVAVAASRLFDKSAWPSIATGRLLAGLAGPSVGYPLGVFSIALSPEVAERIGFDAAGVRTFVLATASLIFTLCIVAMVCLWSAGVRRAAYLGPLSVWFLGMSFAGIAIHYDGPALANSSLAILLVVGFSAFMFTAVGNALLSLGVEGRM